ncbi:MAG: hypothetical protein IPI53_01640 [Saprospiraceae bacterium]|nr:hypothetical protein [Saprospiraceae bacterium]
MKKFRFIFLILGFSLLALFNSCNKEGTIDSSYQISNIENRSGDGGQSNCNQNSTAARIEFGKILYNALKNDYQFANYLKQKMVDEFNSYYSFLYLQEKGKIVHSGLTFNDILIQHSGLSPIQADLKLTEILCNEPLLTVSMSDQDNVSVNFWTTNIPDIAAVKDCKDTRYIIYNDDNINGSIELTTDPTIPTINIISSETYYLVTQNGSTSNNSHIDNYMPKAITTLSNSSITNCTNFINAINNTNENYYNICGTNFKLFEHDGLLQMYVDCYDLNPNPPSSSPPSQECDRDLELADETLVDYRILNWGVYKAIANRFWETKFIFHGRLIGAVNLSNGAANPLPGYYVSGVRKRGDLLHCSSGPCFGKWQPANYRIWRDWNTSLASPYWIDWAEEDNGVQNIGISIPFGFTFKNKLSDSAEIGTSVGITFSLSVSSSSTVLLGRQFVDYCDPIMMPNHTGSLEFRCN